MAVGEELVGQVVRLVLASGFGWPVAVIVLVAAAVLLVVLKHAKPLTRDEVQPDLALPDRDAEGNLRPPPAVYGADPEHPGGDDTGGMG